MYYCLHFVNFFVPCRHVDGLVMFYRGKSDCTIVGGANVINCDNLEPQSPSDKTAWHKISWCLETSKFVSSTLEWRHNGLDSVSNHQPHDCLLNRLVRRRSKKTSKLRVTGLCEGNFPAQMASNADNFSIWRRHHDVTIGIKFRTHLRSAAAEMVIKFQGIR